QGAGADGTRRRQAADRGRAVPRQARRRRSRAQGAGDDPAARGRRRAPQRRQARPEILDPENQGLGDPAGDHRAAARAGRPLCAAVSARLPRGRALERAAGRPGMGRGARARLFQLSQGLDLRRLQRDPAQHHRQGDPGILKKMDFELSEEQRLIKDSLERLLADHYEFEARKTYMQAGFSRELWSKYAELGILGLPFDERFGGFGGGPVETMIVAEAFGRALALEPFLATIVLGGGLLRHGGSDEQRAALLPKIAEGSLLLAFAHSERQSRYHLADVATTARREGERFILDGAKT